MNYIHQIEYKVGHSAIEGQESGNLYNAVVEISTGDNVKYEIHPDGYYLTAVRALNPIFRYPFNYGFIPQTLSDDGDGLDVIIITPEPLAHLSVIEIRPLGFVETIDNGKVDTKIVAVPAYSRLKKVSVDKVMAFLKNYKYPDNETTEVRDYVADADWATKIIEDAHLKFEGQYKVMEAPFQQTQESETPAEPVLEPVEEEFIPAPGHMESVEIPDTVEPLGSEVFDKGGYSAKEVPVNPEPLQEPISRVTEPMESQSTVVEPISVETVSQVEEAPAIEEAASINQEVVSEEPVPDSEVSSVVPKTADTNNQSIEPELPAVAIEKPVVKEDIPAEPVIDSVVENKQEKIQDNSGWLT